jgi:tetratricopeptide (TPR) repeat protein
MAPSTSTDFSTLKESGNKLFNEGKIPEALDFYSQALLRASGDQTKEKVAVLKNQAACYLKLSNYEKCTEVATQGTFQKRSVSPESIRL